MGMFIHPHEDALGTASDGAAYLETKRPAPFCVRRGTEPDSPAVWEIVRHRYPGGRGARHFTCGRPQLRVGRACSGCGEVVA